MKLKIIFKTCLSLCFLMYFAGCANIRRVPDSAHSSLSNVEPLRTDSTVKSDIDDDSQVASRELEEIFLNIEKKIEEEEQDKIDIYNEKHAEKKVIKPNSLMPVEMNKQVKFWIHYFTVRDRERFRRFLENGKKHKEVVAATLSEHGLPPELYYLAMIESGYQSHAVSHASAVGVWQFIRGTGSRYGLAINSYVDERRDPIRATDAAARYLRDLHNAFQSWYLAMASYNAGENRILSAILRGKTRNYWELSEKKLLPRETREYVPKFLAAVIIGRHPEKFGFTDLEKPEYPNVKAVEVPTRVRLSDISLLAGIQQDELDKVNPHLLKKITPPEGTTYEVWIPEEKYTLVKNLYPRLAKLQLPIQQTQRMVASSRSGGSSSYHRVRKGESLGGIARKYRVTVSYLKKINKLSRNTIYPGQNLRVRSQSYHSSSKGGRSKGGKNHYVKQGDSLFSISKKYNVKIDALKRKNNLRRDSIYAGQTLIIPVQ